jgi:predicted tellurium resistance membrane protein TerC|uniref:hypothetical protein n=1 Tax=Nonlabens sp. Ci31 TaxID=2608253 RepID=UPI001F0CEA6C|nr:hypothetical protein [Nonlabens sp. Ci31]
MINIVFLFDSIFTVVGMINGLSDDPNAALVLMIIAVVISVGIMLLFTHPVGKFVNKRHSSKV